MYRFRGIPDPHSCVEVGKGIKSTRAEDRTNRSGVETKKIHTRFTVEGDIGPYVQLRKRGSPWDRRQSSRAQTGEMERRQGDPAAAFASVQSQRFRNQGAHLVQS